MIRSLCALFCATVFAVVALCAADAAYLGKWKFNPSKSVLTGDTATIENTSDGMMQFKSQGFDYKFRLDGKEYPAPDGTTTAWKAVSTDRWEVTFRLNGKIVVTYLLTNQGNTMRVKISQKKPDGGSIDSDATYARVSGGPGFLGKWRGTEVKQPATVLELAANGTDGLTLKDESGFLVNAKFDGKDYPGGGRIAGSKYTYSFKKTGDRSIEITTKLDGKPYYVDAYTVSADGKTLTDNGFAVNAKDEKITVVYDRQ